MNCVERFGMLLFILHCVSSDFSLLEPYIIFHIQMIHINLEMKSANKFYCRGFHNISC